MCRPSRSHREGPEGPFFRRLLAGYPAPDCESLSRCPGAQAARRGFTELVFGSLLQEPDAASPGRGPSVARAKFTDRGLLLFACISD